MSAQTMGVRAVREGEATRLETRNDDGTWQPAVTLDRGEEAALAWELGGVRTTRAQYPHRGWCDQTHEPRCYGPGPNDDPAAVGDLERLAQQRRVNMCANP